MKLHEALSTVVVVGCVGFTVGTLVARADGIPTTTPLFYSGIVENDAGPLTGSVPIGLRLFDDAVVGGDNELCDVSALQQTLVNGEFRIDVSDCLDALRDNADVFAEVNVDNVPQPRVKVGALPFAIEAERASTARGPLRAELDALAEQRVTSAFGANGAFVGAAVITAAGTIESSTTGFLASATRNGAQHYILSFQAGVFAQAPICVVTPRGGGAGFVAQLEDIVPVPVGSLEYFIYEDQANNLVTTLDSSVICVGARP